MKVLAIDTATERCSVALHASGTMYERAVSTARSHAELILPMVGEVLDESGLALADLDAIAFGRGPGAFTGVRIAVGVAQGLGLGTGLPLVGVSTLAAVALQYADRGATVLVCMDARMQEVYWGLFRREGEYGVVTLTPESVSAPDAVDVFACAPSLCAGTGFSAYPDLKARFSTLRMHDGALPRAREIAILGGLAIEAGEGVSAAEAAPVYLRDQVAWPKKG